MAKQPKPKIAKQETMRVKDVQQMGTLCAWAECAATFKGEMPEDWRWMLVYWWPRPPSNQKLGKVAMSKSCDRDAALCPKHALYLESQLTPIMRWPSTEMSGTA